MEWVVQLGFEQDIYLPDELAGMYSWLSMIATARIELLEIILPILKQRSLRFVKERKSEKAAKVDATIAHVNSLLADVKGTEALSGALCTV